MKKLVSVVLVLALALCLSAVVFAATDKVCPVCAGHNVVFEYGKYHCMSCLHTWDEVGMTGTEPAPAEAAPAVKAAPTSPAPTSVGGLTKVCPVCASRAVGLMDGSFHCVACQHHWNEVA